MPSLGELSHIGPDGKAKMVDVTEKLSAVRKATASGTLKLLPAHSEALGKLSKGDALSVAQIAGIQGAKKCSELIPLCHPIFLSHVDVLLTHVDQSIHIQATTTTTAQTGVEMEAYTAVVVAGEVTPVDEVWAVMPTLAKRMVGDAPPPVAKVRACSTHSRRHRLLTTPHRSLGDAGDV